ncbi:MAG TPA: hypothetical protein VEK57_21620 [Thermoanaerobaculia bacterium]|nr:hypothetical protein [Thermoanaerobaculia bacterium]
MRNIRTLAIVALAVAGAMSCSSELTDNAAPVELVVTNTQNLSRLDIDPATTDEECNETVGVINMQVIPKNNRPGSTSEFTTVRVTRYRVSYRRTDGGTVVPPSFVRSIDTLILVGGTEEGSNFTVLESDAVRRAPFVALQPQNGGRDPETGRTVVQMDVTLEVFGETLAGDNVYDATTFPLEFCYGCGGCS